jgi:undecaprenyl-diphosphatase
LGWLESIILGIVQGLTEFLPISSSGHLVIVPALFGWKDPALTFDLVLHLGTLIAVVFAFRTDLWLLLQGLLGRGDDPATARRTIVLLAIGSVPAAVAGLAFGSFFEKRFEDPVTATFFLYATAAILLGAEWVIRRGEGHDPVDGRRSVLIGTAQAVSILPGISRSGSTIAAGLVQKVSRESATRFSFLLSIPAIAGAVATKIPDVANGHFRVTGPVVAGFFAAMIVGWVAIEWLLRYVRTHSFVVFSVYLVVFATISLVVLEV